MTACRVSVRLVFDLGCVVAYYSVLVVDIGVVSWWPAAGVAESGELEHFF